ncbi:MAG TPA: hypothetical protein V6C91_22960 [Coleofasciculaceae cyanobacterium]
MGNAIVASLLTRAPENWKMSLPEILQGSSEPAPSSDELNKACEVQEHMEHLERCFASDSKIAKTAELEAELGCLKEEISDLETIAVARFYKELIEAEASNETIKTAWAKGLAATKRIVSLLISLNRISGWCRKVVVLRTRRIDLCTDAAKLKLLSEKYFKLLYKRFAKEYIRITEVVDTYWNYVPVELHEVIESLAKRVFLLEPSKELAPPEFFTALNNLVLSVFRASERSKTKPKLRFSEIFNEFKPKWVQPEVLPSASMAMATIRDLANELAQLQGVEEVRAIAESPDDLHSITFELRMSPSFVDEDFEASENLWEKAERLALQFDRQLRKVTNEKWYFYTDLVKEFSGYSGNNDHDVAVISKGDGFIWIKRKHYFKPELNHQFFNNYFRNINLTPGDLES